MVRRAQDFARKTWLSIPAVSTSVTELPLIQKNGVISPTRQGSHESQKKLGDSWEIVVAIEMNLGPSKLKM